MENERRLEEVGMEEDVMADAPLIICPLAGDQIGKKIKNALKRYKIEHKIEVKLCERGGSLTHWNHQHAVEKICFLALQKGDRSRGCAA